MLSPLEYPSVTIAEKEMGENSSIETVAGKSSTFEMEELISSRSQDNETVGMFWSMRITKYSILDECKSASLTVILNIQYPSDKFKTSRSKISDNSLPSWTRR